MVGCFFVNTAKNLLVKEEKKREKIDNPVKNLLILRMLFLLSLRINTGVLKISEFVITALLAPFLETKFFQIKKAIKKQGRW